MKIISGPTNDNYVWTMSLTCAMCGTVFEVEKEDLRVLGSSSDNLSYKLNYGTYCPVCKVSKTISESWLPTYVIDDLRKGVPIPRGI